ncbi:CCR4-NOT transcription complex subunit 4 [Clonorchis sinensis]|uniref:CCR4-NOT transcription complex subunit 4 n=1 Tax=Clonorchis sinensis TaxID=79923 RepID=A0A8T1MDK4_CLOSI|nr:CCR4-NOT transcription complex subunit 4 [Clonorchis sinensis]
MAAEEKEVCPLCMEPMEADDLAFYPCDCRYQVCRFCWAKIINEENGLCPACRKEYNSEKPALYKPVSEAEDAKLKANRKRKENLKKTKLSAEMLKLLPELRVVQPNLIFVVGLPAWICKDKEVLKGSEYFGRYGKVFKVEINQNQTFGGPQGQPTFSAYITFCRAEDAMRSIKELDQGMLHGRPLRVSLGTTKYCSQFLRGTKCTKHECMYLHELGDPAASFTKEEMQAGKHTEYMNKLLKEYTVSVQQQSIPSVPSQLAGPAIDSAETSTTINTYSNSSDNVDSTTTARESTYPSGCRTRSGGTADRPAGSPPPSKAVGHNGLHCKLVNGPDASSVLPLTDGRRLRQCRTDRPYSEFSPDGNVVWNRHTSTSDYPSDDGKQLPHSSTHAYTNGLSSSDRDKFSTRGQHKSSGDGRRAPTYYHRNEHRQAVPNRKQHPTEHLHTTNKNSSCVTTNSPIGDWNRSQPAVIDSTGGRLVNFGDDAVDIDFDPFRESQQGLAELLAAEVNRLVVTDEAGSHGTFGVNGHLPVQGRSASASTNPLRPFAPNESGVAPDFAASTQMKQSVAPWFTNFAPPDMQGLQTAGYKHPTTLSSTVFNSCVFPPPGFESSAHGGVHQSGDPSSPMFSTSTSNLLDFGVGESPRSPVVSFNMGYDNTNLACANGPLTEDSPSFSYSATLPNSTNRLDTAHFDLDVNSKTLNGPDNSNTTPLPNGPSAMFRPYSNSMDSNPLFRSDLMRLDPQQLLSHLLATTFHAASGILNNTRLPPGTDKSSVTTSKTTPSFDLTAFVNYLCRLSPLFSSINPQLSPDLANGSATNRLPSSATFPEGLLDSSAVLSAAASILFPAAAAVQLQSKSNEFLSSGPPPIRQNDVTGLSNHGFPPGLSKQAPFLQPTFSNASSEKGGLSLPYASGLRASSELSISDSLTWQLDDPAIVSSQLNASASASQNQTDTNWKPVFGSVSPVDLLQQIWRSGSNVPPFDGHVASYSHYAAQTNSPNNVATSSNQRQTIRDSSLHSASQTD